MKNIIVVVLIVLSSACVFGQSQWSEKKAKDWYKKQGWLVGANFLPSNAINQLEMWQADTWSPELIDKELGLAADIGMNTMRVYLHDIAYYEDPKGFIGRVNEFLGICEGHGIRPMLVFFDSCWDPYPKAGKQKDPVPGVHNSGWVQSPGAEILKDKSQWPKLREYVLAVLSHFNKDNRILAWDMTNEPDNDNANSYGKNNQKIELPNKNELGIELVKASFEWAREAKPSQPITSAPWYGDWSNLDAMNDMNHFLFTNSDIITFHNYADANDFSKRVKWLKQFNRPIICTEYMSRPVGSTFQDILPIAKENNVGVINWGLVTGKSNTKYPWSSWQTVIEGEPPVWFHDVFREDESPYSELEVETIRELTRE